MLITGYVRLIAADPKAHHGLPYQVVRLRQQRQDWVCRVCTRDHRRRPTATTGERRGSERREEGDGSIIKRRRKGGVPEVPRARVGSFVREMNDLRPCSRRAWRTRAQTSPVASARPFGRVGRSAGGSFRRDGARKSVGRAIPRRTCY